MLRTKSDTVLFDVLDAVARERDEPTRSLPPLQEQIDTDALQSLRDHAKRHSAAFDVVFEYSGYTVTFSQDGTVHVK